MPDRLYGFRPKDRPQYQSTDAVVNPVDPRIPRSAGAPPVPTSPLASGTDTRINDYSGTSAEGEGSSISSGGPDANHASYASQQEAIDYGLSGLEHGYYGTVQDAAAANRAGNKNATNTLTGFLSKGPTGYKSAPGLLGFAATQANQAIHGGRQYDFTNIDNSLSSLSETGDLYSTDNSSGYTGDSLSDQQNISDLDASRTYGSFGAAPTVQQQQGPEIFHSLTPDPVAQVQEQQANYDHYQDNSSDDNHGQTDGTQTGGETSHAGGYGGYADDTAATNSDSGGGGGGK